MIMQKPLVSIICLCYNHEEFVVEALQSVIDQTYQNIELIVVDDASQDGSKQRIEAFIRDRPEVSFLALDENIGNCRAFNKAFRASHGEFLIDLAADDLLQPDRVAKQITKFQHLDEALGVVYSDAYYIDRNGRVLDVHSHQFKPRQGMIYEDLVAYYFVAPPTMMIRRKVLDELVGYDENLLYEDFDFWVRSAREYEYAYIDEPLTKIRRLRTSLSANFYRRGLSSSTFAVCRKIQSMNRTESERKALLKRLRYEMRQTALRGLPEPTTDFFGLMRELGGVSTIDHLWLRFSRFRWDISALATFYRRLSSASSMLK